MIPAISGSLPSFETNRVGSVGGLAGVAPTAGADAQAGADFSSVLAKVTTDAVTSVRGAETMSISGIKGEASTQAVAQAVMDAERALQTAVVIRDKVVAAYQEISRMAI